MNFFAAFGKAYSSAVSVARVFPILFLGLAAAEGAQHVVEWLGGMYLSRASFSASENTPARMISGAVKITALTVVGYWVFRYFASKGSREATLAKDPTAVRLFGVFMAFSLTLDAIMLFLPQFVSSEGRGRSAVTLWIMAIGLLSYPIGVALIPWGVASALGDRRASPLFAFRRARGSILWGTALNLAAITPLMVVHYALGLGAIGKPQWVGIGLLAADTVVAAYLGLVLQTVQFQIAQRMAASVGEDLVLGRA
jgi:hypothetical protein